MKPIEKAWEVTHAEATRLYDAGQPPALNDLVPIVITAFLDAIQNDPEAMERVLHVMRSEPGTFLVTVIEALKQEVNR